MKYIPIPEWAERVGISKGYAYSLVKSNMVAGVTREGDRLLIEDTAVPPSRKSADGPLAGKKVGNVLILASTGKKQGTQLIYKCRCLFCGSEFEANGSSVMRGQVTNCGCKRAEKVRANMEKDRVNGTRPSSLTAKIRSDNTTGRKGVSKKDNVFVAYITFKGHRYSLGRYRDIDGAIQARERAELEFFTPFLESLNADRDPSGVRPDELHGEWSDQKGVYYNNDAWRVIIVRESKSFFIGRFQTFLAAKQAYDEASKIDTADGLSAYLKNQRRLRKRAKGKDKSVAKSGRTENAKHYSLVTIKGKPMYVVRRAIDGIFVRVGSFPTLEETLPIVQRVNACKTADELLSIKQEVQLGRKQKH